MKKYIGHITFILAYIVIIVLINSNLEFAKPGDYPEGLKYAKAEVTKILENNMGEDPDYPYIRIGKQNLEMKLLSGEHKGEVIEVLNYVTRTMRLEAEEGDVFIVGSYDEYITTTVMHRERSSLLYGLGIFFVALVILFGQKKGVASIAGLVVTLVNVVFVFMPLLINGVPAIPAAIGVVMVSTLYTMVALNGVCGKSIIATICCTVCTIIAGVLAYVVGAIGDISSLNTPEVEDLLFITENCAFRIDNLLIAGILISALGAVMDTSMSVVSAMFEIKEQHPAISSKQLFKSGINIGKDMMGTMTNTLVLAFVGASINSVVIYYMYRMPYISLMNTDFMVVEVVKGLVGSIAVVLSIPMAAMMTSTYFRKKIIKNK